MWHCNTVVLSHCNLHREKSEESHWRLHTLRYRVFSFLRVIFMGTYVFHYTYWAHKNRDDRPCVHIYCTKIWGFNSPARLRNVRLRVIFIMRGACHSKTRLFSFLSWHALPGLLLPTASYVLCPVFVARLFLLFTQPLLYRDFASLSFSPLSLLSTSNPRL